MNEGEDSTNVSGGVSTGHTEIDEAMATIAALGESDLAAHAATFERAHDVLRAALTAPPVELDEGTAPPAAEA